MESKYAIAGFVLIAGSFTCSCRRVPRIIEREVMTQQEKVERGGYLATVGGCNDCHTPGGLYGAPDATRRLSGSDLGWRGPWGTSYAPNLSPDVETGLGSWSEQEIVRAIQMGVSRDGHVVRPPMPWPSFAHYSDEDALAIAAYLKSLPPVSHRVPSALPPNETPVGAVLAIPPPPAWDAPKGGGVGGGPRDGQ